MGIEVKWSEDKKFATISAEDFEKLQANFDKGYGKGKEAGKKEVLKLFDFLELDENNLEGSIGKYKQTLLDLKAGKFPKEYQDKIKDLDMVKELQQKLQEKQNAYTELENKFTAYKKSVLIDSKLLELAGKHNAIKGTENKIPLLFKSEYQVDLEGDEKIVIKNKNGHVIFDENGDEMTIDKVFEKFKNENAYLFEAKHPGGSGGGAGGQAGVKDLKGMKTEDFNQLVNQVKMGKTVTLE